MASVIGLMTAEGRRFESLVGLAQAMVQAGPAVMAFLDDWGPDPEAEADFDGEPEPEDFGRAG